MLGQLQAFVETAKLNVTGGLRSNLEINIGAHVMLTISIDVDEKLINGQVGIVTSI